MSEKKPEFGTIEEFATELLGVVITQGNFPYLTDAKRDTVTKTIERQLKVREDAFRTWAHGEETRAATWNERYDESKRELEHADEYKRKLRDALLSVLRYAPGTCQGREDRVLAHDHQRCERIEHATDLCDRG